MKPKILNEPYEAIIECDYCGGEYTAVIGDSGQLISDTCGNEICWLLHTSEPFREMKRQRDALLEIVQGIAEVAPGNDHYQLSGGMTAGELRAGLALITKTPTPSPWDNDPTAGELAR